MALLVENFCLNLLCTTKWYGKLLPKRQHDRLFDEVREKQKMVFDN
jgi:hypothetical protein